MVTRGRDDARREDAIDVEIEQLAFEGVAVREPARVEAAFVRELEHLLATRGLPSARAERSSVLELDAGALSRSDFETPERLGRAVAQRVYEELRR